MSKKKNEMTLNDYFDHVYFINLSKDTERYEHMEEVFGYLNISATRWRATTPEVFSKIENPYNISKYHMACLTSHLTLIREALVRGHKKILILEDDIIPVKDFNKKFKEFVDNVPSWDMMYLSYIRTNDDTTMWTYEDNILVDVDKNVIKAKNFWSGMAYALTEKTMIMILDWYENNFPIEIDRFYVDYLQKNPKLKIVGSYPQLFAGVDNFSNNTQKNEEIFERSANPTLLSKKDFFIPKTKNVKETEKVKELEEMKLVNFLGLRPQTDYENGYKKLNLKKGKMDTSIGTCYNIENNISKDKNALTLFSFLDFQSSLRFSDVLEKELKLERDWVFLSFESEVFSWENTLSKSENCFITDSLMDINTFIINPKYKEDVIESLEILNAGRLSDFKKDLMFLMNEKYMEKTFHFYPKLTEKLI